MNELEGLSREAARTDVAAMLRHRFIFRRIFRGAMGWACALLAWAVPDAETRDFELRELEADFDEACAVILQEHPLLYADRAEFSALAERQRAMLRDGMSELEFLRGLSPVVRATNCGHGRLSLSAESEKRFNESAHFLPLSVKVVAGRLFVLGGPGSSDVPAGAEICRIDGRTANEILTMLCDRIPGDGENVTRKLSFINERFHEWYALLVSAAPEHVVEYIAPSSRETVTVRLGSVTQAAWPPRDAPKVGPRQIGDYAFAADHAWLKVASFHFYDDEGRTRFRAFVDGFFNELAGRGLRSLVMDLRGNGGGDPYCGAHLLSYFIREPTVYFAESGGYYPELEKAVVPATHAFSGQLIVLIDGGVFSTTGHVTSLLRYHEIGWFVGEETGGSFACTSNSREITLGHTQLRLSNANTVFRTAVTGLRAGRGVFPDETVAPGIDDLLAGRDGARERAVLRIREGGAVKP